MDKTFIYKEIDYLRDGRQFIDAWQCAFGRNIEERLADWLFGADSNNHLYAAFCEDNNKIVGGYCLLKQEAIIDNKSFISYLCNNVFTVPEYRYYNIFVRLGRFSLVQNSGEQSIALGFPNQLALPGHKRVGWSVCEPIIFFERTPLKEKAKINNDFLLEDISEKHLLDIESLCRENDCHSSFYIVKNKKYFKWRYIDRPQIGRHYILKGLFKKNNLVGYIVLSHFFEKNIIHIIDIMAKSPNEYSLLMLSACNLAHDLKVRKINIWGAPILLPFLISSGFCPSTDETKIIVKNLSSRGQINIIESIKSHNLVLGDNDVF